MSYHHYKNSLTAKRINRIVRPDGPIWDYCYLPKQGTDLPYDIMVNQRCWYKLKHPKPMVLVVVGKSYLPMPIRKTNSRISRKIIKQFCGRNLEGEAKISNWITENYDVLMQHYNRGISDIQVLETLCLFKKKIGKGMETL